MIRVRKQCALIARLVREWWRQMDKIVQAKQKVRLTAKHQQAMNTHLGHVIETTEKYTLWLTEGITGTSAIGPNLTAATDSETAAGEPVSEPSEPAHQKTPLKSDISNDNSDKEFTADAADSEASEDDEETIAKEEELAKQELEAQGICPSETQSAEIEALCKEAEASIIDILPPGYLEHLHQELDSDVQASSSSPPSVEPKDSAPASPSTAEPVTESAKLEKDAAFVPDPNDSSTDDEATMAEQEAHEAAVAAEDSDTGPSKDATQEVNDLEMEAEMPLEGLLARYGLDPAGLKQTPAEAEGGAPQATDEMRAEEEEDEQSDSDSSGSSSDSSASPSSGVSDDGDVEDSDRETSSSNSEEDVGLENLLDDAPDKSAPNNSDSKTSPASQQSEAVLKNDAELNALTADAMSAQPQGNTLAATMVNVKTPFLLTGTLREYQIVGLSWLAAIYEKRLNGILADEMGLGKTIQTIALLAHLACELGIWGPHLIVVPTSVILNWEVEFKRWCPGFKILTYFGNLKERKLKRKGWTKTNAFHVCITSYRLAIQDSAAFKRKKWKYLILDEAQNIKNFKSQRWQTLLTFTSQRRLLLTGTPLQNSLMELWSLMHFLMPNIFQSHREFQEWFASPLTGMIEGNSEYNEQLVMRLHKVLRPFLLRRLKDDVERQMPKKYEHVVMCRLSRRQRYLYDDFMSLSSTRDTLASGQFLSVMNILMQLRKVCNHPNLFEPRPIISPFVMGSDDLSLELPRLLATASHPFLVLMPKTCGQNLHLVYRPSAWSDPHLDWLDRAGAAARLIGQTQNLAEMARDLPGFVARRVNQLRAKPALISIVDTTDTVDEVRNEREVLYPKKSTNPRGQSLRRRPTPVFLPRSVVAEVNEETSFLTPNTRRTYPSLPHAVNRGSALIRVEPPSRPWNAGVPKSTLRSRIADRQHCLSLIARINERRCAAPLAHSPDTWDTDLPGPDLVFLLTALVRCPYASSCRSRSRHPPDAAAPVLPSARPFGLGAWLTCQRALHFWPDRLACADLDGPAAFHKHPADTIGGLTVSGQNTASRDQRVQACLGPEAAFTWGWSDNVCLTSLRQLLRSPADYCYDLSEVLTKFLITIPTAISVGVHLNASSAIYQHCVSQQDDAIACIVNSFLVSAGLFNHCQPVKAHQPDNRAAAACPCRSLTLRSWLLPAQLYQIANSQCFQFPDPRLIQYDCGKLQRLDMLLRDLMAGNHRVLMFTQMARMLDILEQFLAYHGYRYLRLDGTTKVEQRQVLMERFNMDSRIFVFILSTRSGGLGINLTGADTVIFYDSDWNPTMDAQAQDRCHRIGQTRDVHIYRLISERTVEENILRKANQKRLLSDVAIEGGKFTTAFFKQSIISDLFAEPSGLQDLASEEKDDAKQANHSSPARAVFSQGTVAESPSEGSESVEGSAAPTLLTTRSGRQVRWRGSASLLANQQQSAVSTSAISDSQWVAALEACEDENDRAAAKRALDEAQADLAEFDDSAPLGAGALKDPAAPVISAADAEETGDAALTTVAPGEEGACLLAGSASDPLARFAAHRRMAQQQRPAPTASAEEPAAATEENAPESVVERELAEFEALLRPIERFGVNHLESFQDESLTSELEKFEAQLEESKKTWKVNQLKALHEADEDKAALEEDEILYCASSYDPEAARLAELDELERAEMDESLEDSSRPIGRGRRGRGGRMRAAGRARGGVRTRGGASSRHGSVSTSHTATPVPRTDSERSLHQVSERSLLRGRGGVDRDAHYSFDRSRRRVVNHLDLSPSPPMSDDETSRVSFSNRSSAPGRVSDYWRRHAAGHPRKRTTVQPPFYSSYCDFESEEGANDDLRVDQKEEEDRWQPAFHYRNTAGSTRGYRRRDSETRTPPSFVTDDTDDYFYNKEVRSQPSDSFPPPRRRGRPPKVTHQQRYASQNTAHGSDSSHVLESTPTAAPSTTSKRQTVDEGENVLYFPAKRSRRDSALTTAHSYNCEPVGVVATAAAYTRPNLQPTAPATPRTAANQQWNVLSRPIAVDHADVQRHHPTLSYQSNLTPTVSSPGSFTVIYSDSSPAKSEALLAPVPLHATSKLYSSLLQRPPLTQSDQFSGAGHSFVITSNGPGYTIGPMGSELLPRAANPRSRFAQRSLLSGPHLAVMHDQPVNSAGRVWPSPPTTVVNVATPAFQPPRQTAPVKPTVPMRSANIAPPRQYRQPTTTATTSVVLTEPTLAVHSLSNGLCSMQPVRQLLDPTSQPVFVITRQMKTPSGEVFQQQITQPVQPPTRFVQVVRRIAQGPNSLQPQILNSSSHGTLMATTPTGTFAAVPMPGQPVRVHANQQPPAPQQQLNFTSPMSTILSASPLTRVFPANASSPLVRVGMGPNASTRVIRVVRSGAPDAIRILQPRIP
uniref:Helicase domino n=1 Tax=Schistocephalus solidus TaxID=70667 RepID=A0A0X3NT99_SCHSO